MLAALGLGLGVSAVQAQGHFGSEDVYPPPGAVPVSAPTVEAPRVLPRPVPEPQAAAVRGRRASLYAEGSFQALTSDRRQHRLGDLVTVMIYESASASSSADTGSGRDGNASITLNRPQRPSLSLGGGTNNDFNAAGRTQRTGRILAQLTVAVSEVLPNQDLLLLGEQQLEINGEKQVIRLEGRVRPRDISELNTVPSSRVAEAKITFVGDGVLGEKQRPSWWQKLITLFGV